MTFHVFYLASPLKGGDGHMPFERLYDGTLAAADSLSVMTKDDTVFFDGGTDVNPGFYGEVAHAFTQTPDRDRDEWERRVFRRAQAVGAACLGVCRGAQLLTVLSGGKLIQHVNNHNRSHQIVTDDFRTMDAYADHHQQMWPEDIFHHLIAWAEGQGTSYCEYGKEAKDAKEPEIIWIPDTRSLCIQPHPEWMEEGKAFPEYCRELVKKYIF